MRRKKIGKSKKGLKSALPAKAGGYAPQEDWKVKNLANQTTKATDDIAKEIKEMQSVSQNVNASVSAISDTTQSVSQYVNGVAGAIEEQTAVTREISSSMQRATQGISDLSDCIKKIASAQ